MVLRTKQRVSRASSASSSFKKEEEHEEEDERKQVTQNTLNQSFQAQLDRLGLQNTPSQFKKDFAASSAEFRQVFLNDPNQRDAFLSNSLSKEQKGVLNKLNKAARESDAPSKESNEFAMQVRDAMTSKKKCAQKGQTEKPGETLKANLVMKSLLKSIFLVSAD